MKKGSNVSTLEPSPFQLCIHTIKRFLPISNVLQERWKLHTLKEAVCNLNIMIYLIPVKVTG